MLNPNTNALPAAITGGTLNNVPAHIEEVKDAINGGSLLRRLSQAQIDALSGVTRPIGLIVENLTTGATQKWDGAKWVDLVDSSGATFSGDVEVVQSGAGDRGLRFFDGTVRRWFVAFEQATKRLNFHRYNASGVYQGASIILEPSGQVVSSSHVGGVWSGVMGASGLVTLALPLSPSGNWSVTATAATNGPVNVAAVTASSVTFQHSFAGVAATIHWHAIAY